MATSQSKRTTIRVRCGHCDEVDVTTTLEHPRDSPQVSAVYGSHETLAQEHFEETGHDVVCKSEEKDAN